MSSLAYPRAAAGRRRTRGAVRDALERLGPDALLGVVTLALATVLLVELPGDFNVDSWLALVTGREVWQSGIPHHEVLIALALGHSWIDQQWLSQLASYAIYLVGGLGLLGLVDVVLLVGSVGGAVAAGRRLGAPFISVLVTLPLCVALIAPSREVRTQTFAIPLFVAVAYLLARDARGPSRRVYWCLPILVLWANLHGTVTLGAGLVALRGATVAWERRHSLTRSARAWARPLALTVGAGVSILITPYGLGIIGYYHSTIVSGALRQAVSEWQPITSVPISTAALLIIAAAAVWAVGRSPSRSTAWERLALLALTVGSVSVVRNALFFGLFALMVVPVWLGIGEPRTDQHPAPRRALINGGLIGAGLLAVLTTGAVTLARPAAAIELHFQQLPLLNVVERATHADPSLRVLADERFDDWLLWRDPKLNGRVASDARFELLSSAQIDRLENVFSVTGVNWKQGARGDRLLVLDRNYEPGMVQGFLAEPGARVLYSDAGQLVILRSASQAADG
jgi:hypothetical protein